MMKLIKRLRYVAAMPFVAVLALLIPMASPASAASTVVGVGVATGFVHGNGATTLACTKNHGYTFVGVGIAGVTVDGSNPLVGSTALSPQPAAASLSPSGDPLDGTPLGCRTGDVAPTLTGGSAPIIPAGTPLFGCPAADSVANGGDNCVGGNNTANVVASDGTVTGAGAPDFACTGTGVIPVNIPLASAITCSLHGTFMRLGGTVLVNLTGCVKVSTSGPGTCTYTTPTEDVTLVAQVVPIPIDNSCAVPNVSTGFECSALAGPYVITPHGTVENAQLALDALYCPLGTGHTNGLYPPDPHCN